MTFLPKSITTPLGFLELTQPTIGVGTSGYVSEYTLKNSSQLLAVKHFKEDCDIDISAEQTTYESLGELQSCFSVIAFTENAII